MRSDRVGKVILGDGNAGVVIVGADVTTIGAGAGATGSCGAGFVGTGGGGNAGGGIAVIDDVGAGGGGTSEPAGCTGGSGSGLSTFGGSTCAFASTDASTMENANGMATSEVRINRYMRGAPCHVLRLAGRVYTTVVDPTMTQ